MGKLGQDAMLALLRTYEESYYSGESIISDEEYDSLKDAYIKEYGEYDFIPNEGELQHFVKTEHLHPLKSLDKLQVNDEDGLRKELNRLWPVVIQPKFDGLSIEIQETNGIIKFITRGNGEVGDDVTLQCMEIEGTQHTAVFINDPDAFSLRAEILMTHQAFEAINKRRIAEGEEPLSNCRNAASGMLRNKDLDKIEGLTIMLYEKLGSIENETSDIEEMYSVLENIDTDNIRVTPYYTPTDIEDAIRYLNSLEDFRKMIDYDIDGWVVKSNKHNSLNYFGGYTGHHPKNAFAVKGEAKGAWTAIKKITWQVGKQYITPVAELEPVEIEGAVIRRATLHNINFLEAIGLTCLEYEDKYGTLPLTKVKVVKANDVIPRIIEVKHHDMLIKEPKGFNPEQIAKLKSSVYANYITAPTLCPVCRHKTILTTTGLLVCSNDDCHAKLQKKIEQLCSRDGLNIEGMSEGSIKKFLCTFDINNPWEILLATKEDILELDGYAEVSATKLYKAIQKAIKEQDVHKVLYASAIPLIGKRASKDICEHFNSEELFNLMQLSEKEAVFELTSIKDVGKTMALSLYNNFIKFESLYELIAKVNDIKTDKPKVKNQLSFCITGQREPFKSIIEKAGHKVSGSVSKKTAALINSDDKSSTKYTKAKDLGIPILKTEVELIDFLS